MLPENRYSGFQPGSTKTLLYTAAEYNISFISPWFYNIRGKCKEHMYGNRKVNIQNHVHLDLICVIMQTHPYNLYPLKPHFIQ